MRISIHAPLTRCDMGDGEDRRKAGYFNPRTSYEVRHFEKLLADWARDISIHAPLTRCDYASFASSALLSYFNPRTSYEVRQNGRAFTTRWRIFQSTHLLRGATDKDAEWRSNMVISIHAPLTRCDEELAYLKTELEISIHAPLTRCDLRRNKQWHKR